MITLKSLKNLAKEVNAKLVIKKNSISAIIDKKHGAINSTLDGCYQYLWMYKKTRFVDENYNNYVKYCKINNIKPSTKTTIKDSIIFGKQIPLFF